MHEFDFPIDITVGTTVQSNPTVAAIGAPSSLAVELAKEIAHQALQKKLSLYEVAETNKALRPFWKKFTEREKLILKSPETRYTGLSAQKARKVYNIWKKQLQKI